MSWTLLRSKEHHSSIHTPSECGAQTRSPPSSSVSSDYLLKTFYRQARILQLCIAGLRPGGKVSNEYSEDTKEEDELRACEPYSFGACIFE